MSSADKTILTVAVPLAGEMGAGIGGVLTRTGPPSSDPY